jgi:hypothetical protein
MVGLPINFLEKCSFGYRFYLSATTHNCHWQDWQYQGGTTLHPDSNG